jgi:hypothetical protein
LAARYHQEALLEEARNARRQVEQARDRAAEATAAERRLAEFKHKVGNRVRRRQLNRGVLHGDGAQRSSEQAGKRQRTRTTR